MGHAPGRRAVFKVMDWWQVSMFTGRYWLPVAQTNTWRTAMFLATGDGCYAPMLPLAVIEQ